MRFYLDISVIGALFDKEMPKRIESTRVLLDSIATGKHIGFISNIVLEEIERCPAELKNELYIEIRKLPLEVISENDMSFDVLEFYEKEDFIRSGARMDLRHLALASVNGLDAVVSWNFRDMVNIRTRRAVHALNIRLGLPFIEIVSPEEVIEYEE